MTRNQDQLFDGKHVVEFDNEFDRRSFLRTALIVGVGASVVGHALGDPTSASRSSAFAGNLASKSVQGDLDILNYALTLEYLESEFYARGVQGDVVSGRELELVTPIADHEAAHVTAVLDTVKALGGKPVKKPKFKFPAGTFTNRNKFLQTASVFEELGVKAYHGQVTLIDSPDILAAAASIAGVESRHAAILADLIGGNPFPQPIEANLPMGAVLKAAKPFLA
jgi:rubrerythrin